MRTRESDYDYGSFIELTRLLDENKLDEPTLDRVANADMLALNATVRGYDADWDTLTVNRGKNAYFSDPKMARAGCSFIGMATVSLQTPTKRSSEAEPASANISHVPS